jgi:general secretion pathway protein G
MDSSAKRQTRTARQAGVTLIELLVVVTIIAMFGALVLPRLWKKVSGAKQTVAREQINGFITALGMYKLDTGRFPSTEQGLQALRVRPQDEARWDGPYLPQDVPPDPWGHPYVYKYPGEHGEEPDIISYGADGREGEDGENADIVSWKH